MTPLETYARDRLAARIGADLGARHPNEPFRELGTHLAGGILADPELLAVIAAHHNAQRKASGIDLDIVERGRETVSNADVIAIVPNAVRINGAAVLGPVDEPVKIHATEILPGQAVAVTITLFVASLHVHYEGGVPAHA